MTYTLRSYQDAAVAAGIKHLKHGNGNGLIVCPTGGGKALIAANIAMQLGEPIVVFQPSLELLHQNAEKLRSYGYEPAIFSASAGIKEVGPITLATIGSARNRIAEFKRFKHICIDEAHLANAKISTRAKEEGVTMYKQFLDAVGNPRLVGLTATPWKLATNRMGAENRFLTRMSGGLWNHVIHVTQIEELRKLGFLADLEYYYNKGIDQTKLVLNSSGSEYTDESIRASMRYTGDDGVDYHHRVANFVHRLMKYGRKSILVFVPFVRDAEAVAQMIGSQASWVCGDTPPKERAAIIDGFKNGSIRVVVNAKLLTIGFDHPALDTIVDAAPTSSLSLYYQKIGRGLRVHPSKKSTIILDMVGTTKMFGPVENFRVTQDWKRRWVVMSGSKQLTNKYLQKPELV